MNVVNDIRTVVIIIAQYRNTSIDRLNEFLRIKLSNFGLVITNFVFYIKMQ